VITFDRVSVTYADAERPVLRDVSLTVEEGEMCLVVGRTGSGKSTFLGAVNGLVPHFTGGTLSGRVTVAGRDTASHPPRELADLVGVVGQDPLAGFVTDVVEEELAYGMEQLAVPAQVMRKRVEETLDLLGLAELRNVPLLELSGGQQQRVAIGSVLTAHPRVLVLDEPTSALDPTAAEEVLAAVTRLVHDLGVTVILAEHRLERVAQYADRVVHLPGDGTAGEGAPADMFATSSVAPPVVGLGRSAGWRPLPLSVRDARRLAQPLRDRLSERPPVMADRRSAPGATVLTARGVTVAYADLVAVRGIDLSLSAGEVVALMGRNGSGKTSLLWALQGSGRRHSGQVSISGQDPKSLGAPGARQLVGMVPQTPADLLSHDTVGGELRQAEHIESRPPADGSRGTRSARAILDELTPGVAEETHPRDLSEGQRLALVLAVQLSASPAAVFLDEPTRGLDYAGKQSLSRVLTELAAEGRAVLVSTHDVEFVAETADRVVVLADGDVVADGPTEEVIVASPAFAPQVAKILAPLPYLTVDQVVHDLQTVAS
jgi:energy-coupling factor transport system ATP-binding protein